MQKLVTGVFAGLIVVAASSAAFAQNKAAGEAAFQKAQKLMGDGKTAQACEAFDQSQKLDAQLGTQYNLARCWEKLGKLASAWGEYTELAAKDTNPGRRADAEKRAKAIAPRLSKLVLSVATPTPGLVITRDGVDVTLLVDVDTPIDPGTYVFKATAQGYAEWTTKITVEGEGKRVPVEVPALDRQAGTGPVGPVVGPEGPITEGPERSGEPLKPGPVDSGSGGGGSRKLIAYGVGGAGIVATGVGLVFGVQAMGLKDDADKECNNDTSNCPDTASRDRAAALIDDARSKATLSTILVAGGVAAIAGGVILFLTAPSDGETAEHAWAPVISHDQLGFAYNGSF